MGRYKSYKDALALASKSNSNAGASAQQILSNSTSLMVMQHKKCSVFEIFDKVFGTSPNVRPVNPQEIGDYASEEAFPDSQEEVLPSNAAHVHAAAVPPAHAAVIAPPPPLETAPVRAAVIAPPPPLETAPVRAAVPANVSTAGGRAAASFHLAPSKKEKKMDLGEAYLKVSFLFIFFAPDALSRRSKSVPNLWR